MESKAIANIGNDYTNSVMYKGLPSEHEMVVFNTIAKNAADSNMYRSYGGHSGIMMTILAARELGVPPMLALNGGISNIQGKLEISARLMNAMMRRSGIKIDITESSDEKCTLMGIRSDNGDTATVSYSIEDARLAGLVKPNGGWTKNPKDMCFARAVSRLARQIAPDVIGGCYVEGEIRAAVIEEPSMEIEDNSHDEENLQKLLGMFQKEDHSLVMEYIKVVMEHFHFTQSVCVKKFLEEKSIMDKFQNWKSKRKTT